mgnify:CR=1 FL=1
MFIEVVLISLIFILLSAFVILNSLSIEQYKEGNKITVKNTKPKCQYNNEDLEQSQKCTNDLNKLFVSDKGINYSIGEAPTHYIQVCSKLCSGDITTQGQCSKTNAQYNDCIDFLQPPDNCSGAAKPVSYIDNIYYYAQEVLTKSC